MDDGDGGRSTTAAEDAAMADLEKALRSFDWKEGVVGRAKKQLFSTSLDDNVKGVQSLKAMLCIGRDEVYEVAQEVIDSGVVARLVEFLRTGSRDLKWPAAFCLTNVAAGRDEQTDAVVKAGAIPVLVETLRCPDPQLRRQALFCLANVAGSAQWHRQALAEHPDYIRSLLLASQLTGDPKVKALVCWNFRNMCLLGGAPASIVESGINYFVESVWPFSENRAWSSCLRFCCETLATCARDPTSRRFLVERHMGILPDLAASLVKNCGGSNSNSEHVLETLVWLAGEATEEQMTALLLPPLSDLVEKLGVMVKSNSGAQELALRMLALLCTSRVAPNIKIVDLVNSHHEVLLTTPAQAFKGLMPVATAAAREYAALLFVRAATQAAFVDRLFVMLVGEPSATEMMLDILDFGAAGIRSAGAGSGGELFEALVQETLRLMLVNLEQGRKIQKQHGMRVNVAASALSGVEAAGRIRCTLASVGWLPDCQTLAQKILIALQGGC